MSDEKSKTTEEKLRDATSRNYSLNEKLDLATRLANSLERERVVLFRENRELRRDLEAHDRLLSASSKAVDIAAASLGALRKEFKDKNEEYEQQRGAKQELEEKLALSVSSYEKLYTEHVHLKVKYENTLQFSEERANSLNSCLDRVSEFEDRNTALKAQNDTLLAKLAGLQDDVASAQNAEQVAAEARLSLLSDIERICGVAGKDIPASAHDRAHFILSILQRIVSAYEVRGMWVEKLCSAAGLMSPGVVSIDVICGVLRDKLSHAESLRIEEQE